MKECKTCNSVLPLDAFYKGKRECKNCTKTRALNRYHSKRIECINKVRKWQSENPEKHRAYNGKRDAIRRGGKTVIPKGFKIEDTFPFYAEAIKREQETGLKHHVDHIIPLDAGGKHTPSNLQVLTAAENLSKGNRNDHPHH